MEKSLSAIKEPQAFNFTSLHFFFLNSSSFTALLLNFWFFYKKKPAYSSYWKCSGLFLQDRCADDYCKKKYTCSCLSAFSIIIWMAFAFTLFDFHVYQFVVYKNQLLLFLFHICWMLLPRFFRNVRKRWKILHILEPNRPALIPCFQK